jgi:hypothetical protein
MTPSTNSTASAPLARNDYREGQVLRARDLERESGYFLARDRQHGALAHIPGILRGLRLHVFERGTENAVTADALAKKGAMPLDLFLEAGVAVDGYGRVVSVPRREQLRTALATSPSLLREGRYRVELLYDRAVEGAAGSAADDPCAAAAFAGGGGRTVRERYRLRLVENDGVPDVPGIGAVLDGPPDAPEAEAPVALGTVDWNGVDAFIGFSLLGRTYAGVRAEVVASPDERTELDLRDPGGRVAVRFAPEAAPGGQPVFRDAVRIDDQGGVWVRSDLDVGPGGVRFRTDASGQVRSNWHVGLRGTGQGASFGKRPPKDNGEEEDIGPPPEYAPGEQEMRIVFERSDSPVGRRRVVVGHVPRNGGEDDFRPAVIIYDAPPEGPEARGAATVEIWGDLFVRGTAYLTGAQRVEEGGLPARGINDQLDLLLRQLAGPLAGALRAFLLGDPGWLDDLAKAVARREQVVVTMREQLAKDAAFIQLLTAAATRELVGSEELLQGIADRLPGVATLITSLVVRLRTERQLIEGVSVELRGSDGFIQTVSAAAAGKLLASDEFLTGIAGRLSGAGTLIDALVARLRVDRQLVGAVTGALATSDTLLTALVDRLRMHRGLVAALAVEVRSHTTFITELAPLLAGSEAVITQLSARLKASTDLANFVTGQIVASPASVTQAVVGQLGKPESAAAKGQLASMLGMPMLDQAVKGSPLAQKLADVVIDEVMPGDAAFAERLVKSVIQVVNTNERLRAELQAALQIRT